MDAARKVKNGGTIGPFTVADAMDDYLRYLEVEGRSPHSIYVARTRAHAHILPAFGQVRTDALTSEQMREWLADLAKRPSRKRTSALKAQRYEATPRTEDQKRKRRASANRVLTDLQAALELAFQAGRISSNAVWRRVKPLGNADAAKVRWLEPDEARRLVAACPDNFSDLVQAALLTGARYSELVRLQTADFDRKAGSILIRESKSGKPRHIPLNIEGVALFERLSHNRIGSLFPMWTSPSPHRAMTAACKGAKLDMIGFHGLRHTYCSLAIMGGMSTMTLARILGHRDTRMIEKHYGHLSEKFVAKQVQRAAPSFGF
jgi:integrase